MDVVQRTGRAPLMGEPTPGAVTSVGGIQWIGKDGLLMLPGIPFELEGHPTQPDYLVAGAPSFSYWKRVGDGDGVRGVAGG